MITFSPFPALDLRLPVSLGSEPHPSVSWEQGRQALAPPSGLCRDLAPRLRFSCRFATTLHGPGRGFSFGGREVGVMGWRTQGSSLPPKPPVSPALPACTFGPLCNLSTPLLESWPRFLSDSNMCYYFMLHSAFQGKVRGGRKQLLV